MITAGAAGRPRLGPALRGRAQVVGVQLVETRASQTEPFGGVRSG